MFGTNPIAFAAPADKNPPFILDMATSTVAIGKLRVHYLNDKPVPAGWATDDQGRPLTDAKAAYEARNMTPLGGLPEMSSHKGYGLGAMVEILCAMLTGACSRVKNSICCGAPSSSTWNRSFEMSKTGRLPRSTTETSRMTSSVPS